MDFAFLSIGSKASFVQSSSGLKAENKAHKFIRVIFTGCEK